jgi:eukaryotic-like serine/threonine-protein kinase
VRRRRARHAAACGAHEESFAAWFSLGEAARAAHRYVEAEQDYTHALARLPEGDPARRARVLAGRGRVRYRIQRFREALEDLGAARALAVDLGEPALEVELLLEEATVLDWMEDTEGSAARSDEALERAEALDEPRLSLRCALARGRLHGRQGEWERAVRVLSSTAEGAALAREHETHAIALTLLGAGLAILERADEAAERFEEALALCQRTGDGLHLAATLINRTFLWRLRGDVEASERDLRQALAVARELGHAQVERWSLGQLAECLHWMGRTEEALPLARRAHELGVRFFGEHPVAVDAVLLARLGAARGDWEEARRQLDWLAAHCPSELTPPNTELLRRMVALQLREAEALPPAGQEAWEALAAEAESHASSDELTELFHEATRSALHAGRMHQAREWLARAERTATASPLWRPRLDALRERLQAPV